MLSISVLNIKDIANTSYAFRGYKDAKDNFSLSDYRMVYCSVSDCTAPSNENEYYEICERMFRMSNLGQLDDYNGHSMSVSDVVIITSTVGSRAFYCDSFGWAEIDTLRVDS